MTRMRNEGDPDYQTLLADQIHKHYFNDGAFTPAKNIARLQQRVDEIRAELPRGIRTLGRADAGLLARLPEQLDQQFVPGHHQYR